MDLERLLTGAFRSSIALITFCVIFAVGILTTLGANLLYATYASTPVQVAGISDVEPIYLFLPAVLSIPGVVFGLSRNMSDRVETWTNKRMFWIWDKSTAEDRDSLGRPQKEEYDERKNMFAEEGIVVYSLTLPVAGLVPMTVLYFTQEINWTFLAVGYLGLAILARSFGKVYLVNGIHDTADSSRKDSTHLAMSHMEFVLSLAAVISQLIGALSLSTGQLVLNIGTIIGALVSFGLAFYGASLIE